MLVMGITACNKKECPAPKYPELVAINKVPHTRVPITNGVFKPKDTRRVLNTIKALRVSEHYYWTLITNYREEFNNVQTKQKK